MIVTITLEKITVHHIIITTIIIITITVAIIVIIMVAPPQHTKGVAAKAPVEREAVEAQAGVKGVVVTTTPLEIPTKSTRMDIMDRVTTPDIKGVRTTETRTITIGIPIIILEVAEEAEEEGVVLEDLEVESLTMVGSRKDITILPLRDLTAAGSESQDPTLRLVTTMLMALRNLPEGLATLTISTGLHTIKVKKIDRFLQVKLVIIIA